MIDGGLRKLFRQKLPHFFWQSIETGGTGRGVADMHYCFKGVAGWIEAKQCAANAVRIRSEQVAWLTSYARRGGRCFVAVRRVNKAKKLDELHLVPGRLSGSLLQSGLRGLPPPWEGGPACWDWSEIGWVLTKGEC